MKFAVLLVLFLAILPKALDFLVQPTYKVIEKGGIVLTGASSGIGRHAAESLVSRGYTVYAGVRKQKDADKLSSDIPGIVPVILDVTNQDSIDAAKDKVAKDLAARGLPLVALVNNAGVQKDLPVEFQTSEADRFTIDVNVHGLLDTSRAFIPMLRETGDGARMVNIGSLAGIVSSPGSTSYCASKFAVEGITDALRMELAHFGISVSLLQPGYIASQMGAKLHDNVDSRYGLTEEQYEIYRHVFEGFFADDKLHASPEHASSPQVTTDAIVDAITSPTPKTRYQVGNVGGIPAVVVGFLKAILSDRLMDLLQ